MKVGSQSSLSLSGQHLSLSLSSIDISSHQVGLNRKFYAPLEILNGEKAEANRAEVRSARIGACAFCSLCFFYVFSFMIFLLRLNECLTCAYRRGPSRSWSLVHLHRPLPYHTIRAAREKDTRNVRYWHSPSKLHCISTRIAKTSTFYIHRWGKVAESEKDRPKLGSFWRALPTSQEIMFLMSKNNDFYACR